MYVITLKRWRNDRATAVNKYEELMVEGGGNRLLVWTSRLVFTMVTKTQMFDTL